MRELKRNKLGLEDAQSERNIFCPIQSRADTLVCDKDCAWYRESNHCGDGKKCDCTFAYCGDKLIGQIKES